MRRQTTQITTARRVTGESTWLSVSVCSYSLRESQADRSSSNDPGRRPGTPRRKECRVKWYSMITCITISRLRIASVDNVDLAHLCQPQTLFVWILMYFPRDICFGGCYWFNWYGNGGTHDTGLWSVFLFIRRGDKHDSHNQIDTIQSYVLVELVGVHEPRILRCRWNHEMTCKSDFSFNVSWYFVVINEYEDFIRHVKEDQIWTSILCCTICCEVWGYFLNIWNSTDRGIYVRGCGQK